MATEIEIKLAFDPAHRALIETHPLIAGAVPEGPRQWLENVYFDTPDRLLAQARMALRTRRIGERILQTVKCAHSSHEGLSVRPEWEQPYSGRFDFSAVDDAAARTLLDAQAGRIAALFSTSFWRETRRYAPRPGLAILLMIDSGQVEAGARTCPISELELELVEGTTDALLSLAATLRRELPLRAEDISKAERGYQLLHAQQP